MVDQPRPDRPVRPPSRSSHNQGTAPITPDTPIYSYNQMETMLAEAQAAAVWDWLEVLIVFGLGVLVGILIGAWLNNAWPAG